MIRYLKNTDIDKNAWDDCIVHSANGLMYGLSWYLDATSPGWDALILDDYVAVMPLTWKKRYGIRYLVQPPFNQQLGVFFRKNVKVNTADFLRAIPGKFLHLRICLNYANTIQNKSYRMITRDNYELSLGKSYEELASNFSGSHKKNIKRAKNQKITIVKTEKSEDIIRFFKESHKTIFSLPENYYTVLNRINRTAVRNNSAIQFLARTDENEIVAALYLLKALNRYVLLLTPTNMKGKKSRALFLLFDHFFSEYCRNDAVLDFEGSSIESVADFFKGFGAAKKTYLFIKKTPVRFLKDILLYTFKKRRIT
ncbi:MAG: hypothetical protein PVF73_03080 [Bacteroidales bacterium]|jgi:hypothetical protein